MPIGHKPIGIVASFRPRRANGFDQGSSRGAVQ
jgi:hypothetical protein